MRAAAAAAAPRRAVQAMPPRGSSKRPILPVAGSVPLVLVCGVREEHRGRVHRFDHVAWTASYVAGAAGILGWQVALLGAEGARAKELVGALPPSAVVADAPFSLETHSHRHGRPTHVVVCGTDAHAEVQQAVLDLVADDTVSVCVLNDGVSSPAEGDRGAALELMRMNGARCTTSEALLFNYLGGSLHPRFRDVSRLSKAKRPEQLLLD